MTNLLPNTSIPAVARGAVRSYLKSRPEWESYRLDRGIVSDGARNHELVDFAIQHGYGDDVMKLIAQKPAETPAPEALPSPDGMGPQSFADFVAENEVKVAVDTAALLAPVSQFLSPFVMTELEKALAPVIEAANKPAVVQTIEKYVSVPASAVAPEGALPYATKGNVVELGKLFGFTGKHGRKTVHMWDSHGDAPAIDPYFVVDPYAMAMMATALDNGENYWGFGPGGSGKTTMPIQFCARTNRPCVKINFTRNTHVDDLIGGPGIKNGNSGWEDGVLIAAMKRPGTVIILDEPSLAPAGVLGLLQGIADEHRTYTLPTGEKVVAAPGVVFVVADNTAGNGDETGLYAGTNQVNGALVNRFAVMLKIDYLDIETEARAVHNHTLAPLPACTHLAEFVARARKLPSMENAILSIRNMCAFTRRVKLGFSVKEAADVTILSRMPSTERAMLETLFTLDWSADYEALMNGRAVAQPAPVQTYGDNGAFDDETTARLSR